MLKDTFIELIQNYSDDISLTNELWEEIETKYSEANRHYHTLSHLANLLNQLLEIKERLYSWNTILFSLYYHDIVYDSSKKDNEEQSAKLAELRMLQIGISKQIIANCKLQITNFSNKKALRYSNI